MGEVSIENSRRSSVPKGYYTSSVLNCFGSIIEPGEYEEVNKEGWIILLIQDL